MQCSSAVRASWGSAELEERPQTGHVQWFIGYTELFRFVVQKLQAMRVHACANFQFQVPTFSLLVEDLAHVCVH